MTRAEEFEAYLASAIPQSDRVSQAMRYSLLAGGKRLRPLMLLTALDDFGFEARRAFPVAAGLEMVHTYSLIHDDLPAMDNADLRRGRTTCHKKFDEATAILAGDGLLTKAFEMIAGSDLEDDVKTRLTALLARSAGNEGMVLGQCLDLQAEGRIESEADLERLDGLKTGCLLTAPLTGAAIIAGREECIKTFEAIGGKIGLVFQIQDDILDLTATSQRLGKSQGDADNHKSTYISMLGLSAAQNRVDDLWQQVDGLWNELPQPMPSLRALVEAIRHRDH